MTTWPRAYVPPMPVLHAWLPESLNNLAFGTGSSLMINTPGSAVWPSANVALFWPVRLAVPVTVTVLWWANGATASGNVDCGIYDAEGNRLLSTGSTAQTGTTAIQSVNVTDTVIPPGLIYLALAMDNVTGTINRVVMGNATACQLAGMHQQATAFALPATATFAAMAQNYVPMAGALLSPRTVI